MPTGAAAGSSAPATTYLQVQTSSPAWRSSPSTRVSPRRAEEWLREAVPVALLIEQLVVESSVFRY